MFESHDVEFEEVEGREQVTVDLDSKDEGMDVFGNGDPEGDQVDVDAPSAPSTSSKVEDHQVA